MEGKNDVVLTTMGYRISLQNQMVMIAFEIVIHCTTHTHTHTHEY